MPAPVLWLLFLFSVPGGGSTPQQPSCDQLRALWEMLSRSLQLSHVTNEIPILPRELYGAAHQMGRPGKTRMAGHARKQDPFSENSLSFIPSDVIGHPRKTLPLLLAKTPMELPSRPDPLTPNGYFGDFGPVLPPIVQDPTEPGDGFFEPQWASPEEVGTFGKFFDSAPMAPHVAKIRAPMGPRDIHGQRGRQVGCVETLNRDCSTQEDCFCLGVSTLHCLQGKCAANQNFAPDSEAQLGTWHEAPLPRSELGLISKFKKRTTFM